MDDFENENAIFMYWSREEINFYYELMLQQIDNQKINDVEKTIEDDMW